MAATIAALAIIAATSSLGLWQLERANDKRAQQALRDELAARPAVDVAQLAGQPPALDGMRVVAQGRWLPEAAVLLDNRTHEGIAGFHVLMPLELEASAIAPVRVLVLRGFVPRDPRDRSRLPVIVSPAGPVSLDGQVVADLPQPMLLGEDIEPAPGERLWQRFDLRRFERWSGFSVRPYLIRQVSASEDGLVRDWPAPGDGVARHHGYAFQWFAMSVAAALAWAWAALRRRR